jgi:autoinducer 2-degrading protein
MIVIHFMSQVPAARALPWVPASIKKEYTMHVTLVHVHVKPEHVEDFIEASRVNREGAVDEPGNRRFDLLQLEEDPTRFILYEAYASAEEAAAHKQTPHYLQWRETVADWMAEPRQGVVYRGLHPNG